MAYTPHTRRIVARLRADLAHVTDQQTRDLVRAWVAAWNEVAPDLNATLLDMLVAGDRISRVALMRSERLRKVLTLVAFHLQELSDQAQVRILGDLERVIDIAGSAQASIIDSQLPAGSTHLIDLQDWTRVDDRALSAIVHQSTQQITSTMRPLSADATRATRLELLRGYAAGQTPRATAARIVARTEGRFNGGLTRALAIARTEMLDASRAGAHLGRMQNADVLRGWSWHCELSPRSCPACISMDGQVFPLDVPGPDDHVNGRCTAVPETKTWAELGIDLPEPTPIRQDAGDWFAEQPATVQKQILGPSRYEAWKAGDYPMQEWAHTVANPDWRSSVQVTKPPASYSGGRARGSSLAS